MKSRLFLRNGRDFIFCMHRLQGREFFTAESTERSTGHQLFTAERTELHRFTGNRRLGFGGLTNWCGPRGRFFGKSDDRAVLFFVILHIVHCTLLIAHYRRGALPSIMR